MKTALIPIDIQIDYFPGGKWELPRMEAASQNAKKLLSSFRANHSPIFHVQHIAQEPNAPFFVSQTEGVEIHQSVRPQEGEKVIKKHFPNSFLQTTLLSELRDSGIERLVICGAMSNMCIDATTRAAVDLGFKCVVASDACAAQAFEFQGLDIPAEQVHASFMAALAFAYAQVVPTSEAVAFSESKE